MHNEGNYKQGEKAAFRMVEKIANKTTDKELIFKIYKQLMQLNTRKINDPIKNWAKELNGHSPRKTHMRLTNTWKVMLSIAHYQSSSVQSLSRVQLFVTPWTAARQASLSITNSQSSPKLMDQRSNPCLHHWQANSLPLSHQGSPLFISDTSLKLKNTSRKFNDHIMLEKHTVHLPFCTHRPKNSTILLAYLRF